MPGTFVLGGATPPGKRRPVDEGPPRLSRPSAPFRARRAAALRAERLAGHGQEADPHR